MSEDYVVFTALFGGYEALNELEIERSTNTRYVCFTDDPELKSLTWEIFLVNKSEVIDPARMSREIKMLGYRNFPISSRTLYIDNSVKLKVDGSLIIDSWLCESDVAFMHHYQRKSVRNEFFMCSAYVLDNQETLWKQFRFYKENYRHVLSQKPYWGGMIARLNSPETDKLMLEWKRQYDLFSRRDQLSINVSSIISNVSIRMVKDSNAKTQWHEWPFVTDRKNEMRRKVKWNRFNRAQVICNAIVYGLRYFLPAPGKDGQARSGHGSYA